MKWFLYEAVSFETVSFEAISFEAVSFEAVSFEAVSFETIFRLVQNTGNRLFMTLKLDKKHKYIKCFSVIECKICRLCEGNRMCFQLF